EQDQEQAQTQAEATKTDQPNNPNGNNGREGNETLPPNGEARRGGNDNNNSNSNDSRGNPGNTDRRGPAAAVAPPPPRGNNRHLPDYIKDTGADEELDIPESSSRHHLEPISRQLWFENVQFMRICQWLDDDLVTFVHNFLQLHKHAVCGIVPSPFHFNPRFPSLSRLRGPLERFV
ncbi:protein kinase family protein, partial [Reticulomyxa filosa]